MLTRREVRDDYYIMLRKISYLSVIERSKYTQVLSKN